MFFVSGTKAANHFGLAMSHGYLSCKVCSNDPKVDLDIVKVSKGAKIRNRYNQVPHLTQDTNGKVTKSHLYTTNESQEVSPFPAGDHKALINRCVQMHSTHKTEKNIKDPQKKYHLGTVSKVFYWGLKLV